MDAQHLLDGKTCLTYLVVVLWHTPEHQACKHQTDHRQGPNDVHDDAGCDVDVRVDTVERVAPVPQCRHPNLLQALHDARTRDPDLGSGTSFLSEIEAEEQEAGGRSASVAPGRYGCDNRAVRRKDATQRGEADEREGDGKDEPR